MSSSSLLLTGVGGYVATGSSFNPVSDWSLPPLHAFSTADSYWIPPADTGSVSSWRNAGSAVKGAYIGAKGLVCPGLTTDYASTPDSAALDITGDITLVVDVTATDWTPAANSSPVGKTDGSGGDSSWAITLLPTGYLRLFFTPDGTTSLLEDSTVPLNVENGTRQRIGITLDVDNGAGGHDVKFYTSSDGVVWTQLGATVTTVGTTSIYSGPDSVWFGRGSANLWSGTVHRAKIYSGIHDLNADTGGTLVLDANFEAATEDATSFTESSSNAATVTVVSVPRAAHINANGLALQGNVTTARADCATIADNAVLRPTGDIEVIVKATAIDWTPTAGKVLVLCGSNAGNLTVNWYLYYNTTGTLTFARPSGATARNFTSSVPIGILDGATKWIKATFDQNNGSAQSEVKFYLSDDGSSWTQLGSTLTDATTTAGNSDVTGVTIGQGVATAVGHAGTIHRVIAKDGIGGTTFLDVDFEAATEDATSFTESSSNAATVTINSVPRAAYINADGLALPGVSGNYASTPDNAVLDITGDITLVAHVAADDWTPSSAMVPVAKWQQLTGNQRSYMLQIRAAGKLAFVYSTNGTDVAVVESTVPPTVSNGAKLWIAASLDADNGASDADVKFWTSTDGSSWTQLGSTVNPGAVVSIHSGSALLEVGSHSSGVSSPLGGKVYQAQVYSGVRDFSGTPSGGTLAFDADFESATPNVSQFTESSSNAATVTINNTVDVIQATGSKQPTYDAANAEYNNAPTVNFTTDDVLAMNPTDVAQPYYAVVLGDVTSGATGDVIVGFGTTNNAGIFEVGGDWYANAGTSIGGGVPDDSPHLFVARLNGALSSLEVDGKPVVMANAGTQSLTALALGASVTTIGTYQFYISGAIHTALIFQGDPRLQPEWADFEAYVESTTAIDVTPAASTLQAPTLLDSALYSPTNTCTSASISPTADSLLIITCVSGATAGTFAFSSTTLSNISSWGVIQQSSGNERVGIMWAKITGSPGTGTITITGFGTPGTTRAAMQVMEVVGAQRIRQTKIGTTTSATPSITLDYTPESASLVIGAIGWFGGAMTPGTNFTELAELSGGNRMLETEYDLTSATTTVGWTLSVSALNAMAAIEVTDE